MFFKQVYEKGLAQASYIVGCQATGEAIVIDPKRDIDTYLQIAEEEKLRITNITETHIHADFLSGSRELAAATGAELYLSGEGGNDWQYQFQHHALHDGDEFRIGNLKFQVMHTPGHTPEHISFLLTDLPAGDFPVMLFTGDFVFVGDVGRPDLLEKAAGIKGTQVAGARQMFESLKKFKALPDYIQVMPGHGAGSACGKALGAVPSTTVGYERLANWALKIEDEETFVSELLAGQPEPPAYFAMMKKLNKTGPAVLGALSQPRKLSVAEFEYARRSGVRIIDTRDKLSFAGGHVPGSINIQDNKAFSTWAGWILEYEKPFVLVAPEHRIGDLSKALLRIGLDGMEGYIDNLDRFTNAGRELEVMNQLTVNDLDAHRESYLVLDVRGYSEYAAGHIPGAMNIHAGHIERSLDDLPRQAQIAVHCASGDRSAIAASVLAAHGFTNIHNVTGGFAEWSRQWKPVETGLPNRESVAA